MRPPTPGECHVWRSPRLPRRRSLVGLLSAAEAERLAMLHLEADRELFVTGAAVLRIAASGYLGVSPGQVAVLRQCPDCALPHGRPVLADSGLHVSVSHSGDQVLVAFSSDAPVGVDIEFVDTGRDMRAMAARILSEPERRTVGDLRTEDYYRYWTRKEAVLKATGDGLRKPMSGLTVSAPGEPPRLLAFDDRPHLADGTALADLAAEPGYAAAVAVLDGRALSVVQQDAFLLDP